MDLKIEWCSNFVFMGYDNNVILNPDLHQDKLISEFTHKDPEIKFRVTTFEIMILPKIETFPTEKINKED